MSTRGRAVAVGSVIAALTVGLQGSAAADRDLRPDLDAVALSMPDQSRTYDSADKVSFVTAWASDVRLSGVAATSVVCDWCIGTAETVQVVRANAPTRLIARNVATAWSGNCTGCFGWAVSIQVVIAHSQPAAVVAGNRALALNAGCVVCQTRAAAVQFVLVDTSNDDLSAQASDAIYTLRDALVQRMRERTGWSHRLPITVPQSSTRRSAATADGSLAIDVQRVQRVLATDLQAGSASHSVKITAG
jgi:hypothetical protein